MSMPLSFFRASAQVISDWRAAKAHKAERLANETATPLVSNDDPNDWSDVLAPGADDDDADDELASNAEILDLDWQHFGLSYLVYRAIGRNYELADLAPEIFGRNLGICLNADGSIHDTVVLDPDDVVAGLALLQSLDAQRLRRAWNPEELTDLGVHPITAWREPRALDELISIYFAIVRLFERAVEERSSLVVQLAL